MDKLSFEEWFAQEEQELNTMFAETGMDRELDFNPERETEKRYENYLKQEFTIIKGDAPW